MSAEGSPVGWMDEHPREALRRHGLGARRTLGQNFLIAAEALDRVVEAARLDAGDRVLEVGTGLGRLTARLARAASHVVSVEIDPGLHAVAAANLAREQNVTLVRCDFLQSKHRIDPSVTAAVRAAPGGPLKVVSNLPYGISSPATVALLEWDPPPAQMCLMLQKEVAARMTAGPAKRDYGALTVIVDYWATVETLFALPPQAFWPQPDVSSALVRLTRRAGRIVAPGYEAFARLVRELFTRRRKTLGRALRDVWGRRAAEAALAGAGIDPEARAETLHTAEFEALAVRLGIPEDA